MSAKFEDTNVCEDFYDSVFDDGWHDEKLAFIKHDGHDGDNLWIIYDSDGSKIAATSDRDFAFIVARQNDFEPCSVH